MKGMIELSGEGAGRAYLATPDGGTRDRPGVLVLQEMWGLTPHIRDVADRFADEGFVAIAPDFWDGWTTREFDRAIERFLALDVARAEVKLRAAVAAFRAQGIPGPLGAVGFCMGGQLALYVATLVPDEIGAVANFYGIQPHLVPDYRRLRAPVLGLFGERDPHVTPAHARALQREIEGAGKQIELVLYPADHAFFNDTRPEVYDEASAQDAWKRVLSFFHAHLRQA